jgi:hypothetical protein
MLKAGLISEDNEMGEKLVMFLNELESTLKKADERMFLADSTKLKKILERTDNRKLKDMGL